MDWEVAITKGLVPLRCILPRSTAATPQAAFEEAARALGGLHGIDEATLVRRLGMREGRGSTALGFGFAMPHADSWGLRRPQGVYLRSSSPLGFFGTRDHVPIRDMLLLVAPRPATAVYGGMLNHYKALIARPAFREKLLALDDEEALWLFLREHEWNRETSLTTSLLEHMHGPAPRQLRVSRSSKTGRS